MLPLAASRLATTDESQYPTAPLAILCVVAVLALCNNDEPVVSSSGEAWRLAESS